MWLPILALIIGFCAVFFPHLGIKVKAEYAEYLGVAVVAGFDSIVGAIRGVLESKFSDRVFVSGFFTNAIVAALLLYFGNTLNIPNVALAILVAFIIRIFNNLGFLRRYIVARLFEKRLTNENTFPEP
jgi:small basic protein